MQNNNNNNFTLFSNELSGQATLSSVFNGFGCTGQNLSPQFHWSNAPEGTKSFALTLFDPDAPTGSGWWHWLIFNIHAKETELLSGAGDVTAQKAPLGSIQSVNDYGQVGYGGPCPPVGHGIHQYIFTLYALDVEHLDLDASANPALVGFNLNAHAIQKASLVMYYKR
jgi:Raf kinase inhibitor-like YbhB/YbcL family protein